MEKDSLKNISDIFDNFDFEKYPYLKFILVENKIDQEDKRRLSEEVIDSFINDNSDYIRHKIKLSVKDGQGFEELKEKINIFVNKTENKDIAINYIIQDKDNKYLNCISTKKSVDLILLGDSKVGKSTFFNRFNHCQYQKDLVATIGMEKISSHFKMDKDIIKVDVSDTAGQDRYRALARQYYKNADGIFLLFDVGCKESFDNIALWMDQIKDNAKEKEKLTVYLIGNKIDDISRVVSKQEAEEKAQFLGLKYFEMSCRINMNVMEVTTRMIKDCCDKKFVNSENENFEPSIQFIIKTPKNSNRRNGNCCNR